MTDKELVEMAKKAMENNQTEKEEEKQQPETENDEKVDVKGEDEKETMKNVCISIRSIPKTY